MTKHLCFKFFLISCCSLSIFFITSCQQKAGQNNDAQLQEKAQQLAKQFIIIDGHIDLPYRLREKMEDVSVRTSSGDFDYVRAKEGGLDAPFMSIYVAASYQTDGGAKAHADSLIDLVEQIARDHGDKFAQAFSPEDIKRNFEQGKISLPMGMENGAPIEEKIENVKHFYNRGIRYITLTHGKDNFICDSATDTTATWNGLSPAGKKIVAEMNRLGMMVDVSHISDSAFYQVMRLSKAPVIASHSSCRHFTPDQKRNMTDDMIKLLAAKKGVIQISFGTYFLDNNASLNAEHISQWLKANNLKPEDPKAEEYIKKYKKEHPTSSDVSQVADHIDHVVKIAGIDYVGLGSDFDGVDGLPKGLEDVSKYPNLIYHLLKRGYSEEDIEKICYKNVFRVWNEVEKTAKDLQQTAEAGLEN